MKIKIHLGHALAIAAACMVVTPAAAQPPSTGSAQAWPARPVRIIVAYPPGGGVDTVVRVLAQKLTGQLGGSFVVENRPGGTGVLAAELVARAAPDGYTFLASANDFATNPSIRSKLPYDPFKDFTHITQLAAVQFILASHPSVPIRNVKQLLALAKARPGQLTFGSSGTAGGPHFAGELFQSMAGIRWVHVPFKGAGPAIIGVISGEIDFVFAATIGLLGHVKAGKVRAVAVTGLKRFVGLPEVPTVAESGVPGYSATGFYGFYAPAGTSADIVRRIHAEAARALGNPEVKEKLARSGSEYVMSSPEEFVGFLRAEITKWTKVAKESNIRID